MSAVRVTGAARGAALALGLSAALALMAGSSPAAHAFDVKRADSSTLRVVAYVIKEVDGKVQPVAGGRGTGFVIDREYVATNYHVVFIDDQLAKIPDGKPFHGVHEP